MCGRCEYREAYAADHKYLQKSLLPARWNLQKQAKGKHPQPPNTSIINRTRDKEGKVPAEERRKNPLPGPSQNPLPSAKIKPTYLFKA
jgi:hypothetical protein